MGCSNVKENVTIDISYCGGCGWSLPAKKICEEILLEIP
jgi:predicted Rdx family selenoprotein